MDKEEKENIDEKVDKEEPTTEENIKYLCGCVTYIEEYLKEILEILKKKE